MVFTTDNWFVKYTKKVCSCPRDVIGQQAAAAAASERAAAARGRSAGAAYSAANDGNAAAGR